MDEKNPGRRRVQSPGRAASRVEQSPPAGAGRPAGRGQRANGDSSLGPGLATVVVAGIGALIFEAELIPGILIGAGAVLAPSLFRGFGTGLRPLAKNLIRAGYSAAMKGRQVVEQAREEIEDVIAEARTETDVAEELEEEAE